MQNGRVSGDRVAICPSGSRVVMYHVKAVVDHLLVQHAKGVLNSRSAWYCIAPIDSVDVEVVVARRVKDIVGHSTIPFASFASTDMLRKKSSSSVMEPKLGISAITL
mmetsp:Transcript_13124/g.31061  ORF Transcript_13124/g.31061 Transcript_13124/m.31061 type:complete len:107 (+) Transcript_13124:66-386(+)